MSEDMLRRLKQYLGGTLDEVEDRSLPLNLVYGFARWEGERLATLKVADELDLHDRTVALALYWLECGHTKEASDVLRNAACAARERKKPMDDLENKARLDRVTITGADDDVDPAKLVDLVVKYPLAEVGILFGNRSSKRRFPGSLWVRRLVDEMSLRGCNTPLAAHLCGHFVDDVLVGEGDLLINITKLVPLKRVQVNTHAQEQSVVLPAMRRNLVRMGELDVQVVFQRDGVNNDLFDLATAYRKRTTETVDVATLYDLSHGAGVLPSYWPPPVTGEYCGYAGGLGPDNVAAELEKISRAAGLLGYSSPPFWIDAETKLRDDDDQFDLEKAEAFLARATEFQASSVKLAKTT